MGLTLLKKEKLNEKILDEKLRELALEKEDLLKKIKHVEKKRDSIYPGILTRNQIENTEMMLSKQRLNLKIIEDKMVRERLEMNRRKAA